MSGDILRELLEGNRTHTESLSDTHFDDVQDAQHPPVVSVCCSDSRVSQEKMWAVDEPGFLFTPSNIGNQAWDGVDDERVVNGNLLYPVEHTGTRAIAVVGHTSCGAITAAYRAVSGTAGDAGDGGGEPAGIQKWVDLLVPVVEDGLASDVVDTTADDGFVIDQLVEYNVRRQVEFLVESDDVPTDAAILGFVYDFQGVYGEERGRAYLVDRDGETETDTIAAELPDSYEDSVRSVLH